MSTAPNPKYAEQLRNMIKELHQSRAAGSLYVLMNGAENAEADDDTDKKLDWYSIALFQVLSHNAAPGLKDDKPVDPDFVKFLENRFENDIPKLFRPLLIERQFKLIFEGGDIEIATTRAETLILDLVARVIISTYMLEEICTQLESEFDEELDAYLTLAIFLLQEYQEQGAFLAHWELPPIL